MKRFISCLAAAAVLAVLAPPAPAQPKQDDIDQYRRLFKKPTNAAEFWKAIRFELDVGRYDLAAQHLRNMLDKKPTQQELLRLHEENGIAPFLRLRIVTRWDDDPTKNKQAQTDSEDLIRQITETVRARLNDPNRIKLFVRNLYATPEESEFARVELGKSGAVAIPYLLEELAARPEAERPVILSAISGLSIETVPPLLAALDMKDAKVREHVIDALRGRRDFLGLKREGIDAAPFLWPLASSVEPSERVRRKASEALALLYGYDSPSRLPRAKVALTDEAERYYNHRVRFADPRRVPIWRYDGKKLFEDTSFTASKAEEYYGLRFARQALDIDPAYEPAQVVYLSLLLDKGHGPAAQEQPLGTLKPSVLQLLPTLNVDLVQAVLDRALRDGRTPVVVAAARALGRLGDPAAIRPGARGEPPLVRTLSYGDRRARMAAADSILRTPGAASTQATSGVVDVLRLALAPEAAAREGPRILLGLSDLRLRNEAIAAVKAAGGEAVIATTGREVMRRLRDRADIDAVAIDSVLPDPGLPFLLAQLRADEGTARLPVLLVAVPAGAESRGLINRMQQVRAQIDALGSVIGDEEGAARREIPRLYTSGRAAPQDILLADQRRRKVQLEQQLLGLSDAYDQEAQRREEELRRYVEQFRNVWVVPTNQINEPRVLQARLQERLEEAAMPPLSRAERKEYAETALYWLARMATGELRGFDVRPAADAVIGALLGPPLGEEAMVNAVRFAGTVPSARAQNALIDVVVKPARALPVRVAAAEELQRHIQRFGRPDPPQERALKAALQDGMSQAALPAPLRERFARLIGALRPSDSTTGQRLKDFQP